RSRLGAVVRRRARRAPASVPRRRARRETLMLFDRIDVRRLRRDIASVSEEIRTVKRLLRQTWTRPMADEQRGAARLARRATEMCVLRARMRGRWHVTSSDPEWDRAAWHARIAERVALDYTEGGGAAAGAAAP